MTRRRKPVRMDELVAQCHFRFSRFTEEDFANWLESGFRVYHTRLDGKQIGPDEPFGFVSGFIGFGDSLLDDLTQIFRKLVPEDQKPIFRKSIAKLLMKVVSREHFPFEAVRELIYLIERVGADESLPYLATVVQTGRYGAKSEWLQIDAIRVLKQMLGSADAVLGLYDLAAAENFKVELSLDVLESLCNYVPQEWPRHVMMLATDIGKWHEKAKHIGGLALKEFEDHENTFFETFVRQVAKPRIGRTIGNLFSEIRCITPEAKRWVDDRLIPTLMKESAILQVSLDFAVSLPAEDLDIESTSHYPELLNRIPIKDMASILEQEVYLKLRSDIAPQLESAVAQPRVTQVEIKDV